MVFKAGGRVGDRGEEWVVTNNFKVKQTSTLRKGAAEERWDEELVAKDDADYMCMCLPVAYV